MPSAARYLSFSKAEASPPLEAQLTPMMPDSEIGSISSNLSILEERGGKISLMAIAPSTMDFSIPMGCLISVTLAGQGVRKKQPIFSTGIPVRLEAPNLANPAAVSMGERKGSTWEHKSGKRTRISRTTAGQAELMTGRGKDSSAISRRVASDTSSAARETSNTSSNPSCFRPVRTKSMSSRLLNCPYRDGAGRAMV